MSTITEYTVSHHSDGRTHVDFTYASGKRISGWLQHDPAEQARVDDCRASTKAAVASELGLGE